jgi:hypothetical protein
MMEGPILTTANSVVFVTYSFSVAPAQEWNKTIFGATVRFGDGYYMSKLQMREEAL